MSAKYLFRKYLKYKKVDDIFVDSAGITAKPQDISPEVKLELKKYGIDPSDHKQKKLTQKLINDFDLVVAMSTNHKEFILKNFNKEVPLFLEIVLGKTKDLKDNSDVFKEVKGWAKEEYNDIFYLLYICCIPEFYNNFEKFISQ
jgi:protein-tyrosine-phosphatase